MGTFSPGHWLVVIAVVLIVFGAGRLPKAMGDLARGLRSFKAGLQDDPVPPASNAPAETPTTDQARG